MYHIIDKFINIDYRLHLLLSLIIRFVLIVYGNYHDQISEVKYTDIDYKVFTDASRHILNGESPYQRHTYRYSPLVALVLTPNVTLHHNFGKIVFSFIDILVAMLIRLIVRNNMEEYENYKRKDVKYDRNELDTKKQAIKSRKRQRLSYKRVTSENKRSETNFGLNNTLNVSMLAWLYNPLTIAIGTRGNCDSLAGFLVLSTLYVLQCKRWYFTAGMLHGLTIHFRIYPIVYSLTYFLYLSDFAFYTTVDRKKRTDDVKSIDSKQTESIGNVIAETSSVGGLKLATYSKKRKTIFKKEYLLYLIPNAHQIKLVTGCLLSLTGLTLLFYQMYDYKFLYEAYIYHVIRKDTRHNFSLYFYLQYLTAWVKNIGMWQKVLMILPQFVLISVFSVRYGLNRFSLNFAVLVQTVVMVIYNAVLTSQYFVWVMAVLPLCLWQIKMPKKGVALLLLIWFAAQGAWLLPAYLLEFHGQNTFLFVWIQSVSLFCANIAILGRLIMYFMPGKEKC